MLETHVIVVRVDGQYALVQASQDNGCGQCSGGGCGKGNLSRLFCSEPRQFRVGNPINASIGDEVVVSVADGAVLRGIGLAYLLPLALLVTGAMLGNNCAVQAEQRDGYAAAGAVIGLIGGFVLSGWIASRRTRQQNLPYIARRWRE